MAQSEDKPSIEEVIEHFGKKGMKWGVRRNKDTGVRPIAKTLDKSRFGKKANANAERHMARQIVKENRPAKVKPTTAQIREARANTQARQIKIIRADQDVRTATTKHGKDAALKIIKEQVEADAKSGDSQLAARMTRGEKVGSALLFGAFGALVVSNIAAGRG